MLSVLARLKPARRADFWEKQYREGFIGEGFGAGGLRFITPKNSKGCDIGYALTANSCEGVSDVDACTVTALDATTAFAVPYPDLLLAELVGFFGSGCSLDHSTEPSHPVYFGFATFYFG